MLEFDSLLTFRIKVQS